MGPGSECEPHQRSRTAYATSRFAKRGIALAKIAERTSSQDARDMARELPGTVDEAKAQRHAEMLGRRAAKTLKKLKPRFDREGIGAFRLYDRDIPEVRAVVDWYEGHLVLGEYARAQTEAFGDWLHVVGLGVAEALKVPPAHLHLKRRRTRPRDGHRYEKSGSGRGPGPLAVRERGLRFRVNLRDYLDTGIFLDQRDARREVKAASADRSVLNLFAYTGTFTAAALAGGAKHVTSVDVSKTYLDWTQSNLRENGLPLERHEPARTEAFAFLEHALRHGRRWDLVIVDPPSFSTTGGPQGRGFDIQRDHEALLQIALRGTAPGGTLRFSTNHQRFELHGSALDADICETTNDTVPVDFRNRQVHRSWRILPNLSR